MVEVKEKSRLFMDIFSGIAVSMLIIFITLYLPVLGFFMAVILPMPILYFRLKLGRKPGAFIMLAVFIITFIAAYEFSDAAGSLSELSSKIPETGRLYLSVDMLFYGAFLLTGFFLGEFLEQRISIEKSFVYTLISTIGICSAGFFLYAGSTGQEALSIVSGYVDDNLKLALTLYESMGMTPENIEMISASIQIIRYVLIRVIPGILVSMLAFVVWVNTLFIKKILDKKGILLKALQNLNRWRAPEHIVWVVIVLGVLMLIPGKEIKIIAFNLIMILMPIYFFQGIAVISFIFEQKNVPALLKISIYSIIAIQQILVLAIVGLGFFDTWMNFRKIGVISNSDEH